MTARAHLRKHHDDRLRRAYADAPRDPLAGWFAPVDPNAPIDPFEYTGSCEPCRHNRLDNIAWCDPCLTPSPSGGNEKYRFEPIPLVTDTINPGLLLDVDPAMSAVEYQALADLHYPEWKDVA